MRRLWAAVKLAVLGAMVGMAVGLGAGLGATALYRWGQGQSAAPASAAPPPLAAGSDVEGRPDDRRLLVASGRGSGHDLREGPSTVGGPRP
jgi:hypothetical protein